MTSSTELPVIAGVDGSPAGRDALDWAAREAQGRGLGLVVVHALAPTRRAGQEAQQREAEELLTESVARVNEIAPGLHPTTLAPLDFPAAALTALSRAASMVVVGSRGLGGFRSLMLGSNSLATASMARCPVVVVHGGMREGDPADEGEAEAEDFRDVVAGVAADESSGPVLEFAFTAVASRPGARLRIVHGWTMFSSMLSGGPAFDRDAAVGSAERTLAELTAGRREMYPQAEVVMEPVNGSASRTLVAASATAALTVIGRRRGGESLGLGLSPVAQTTLTHARGPVAVVPG
ncbi:nucleotide-binding universal stress UspA family protein [Streptomyces sp. 840.1]|uniref:universal stress protein n=1 Tax=Streptomyces sp. 840.1 TaxID=2485152 RepID=UPI000F47CA91|nr:universal stress protein [Streptomyces sp. 840.1]ROQ63065.1 nucleotide-binding universal stress UspA family protein [Streptomyces sp. 840.1]